jgi:uncharacterized protein with PQ loop repeat
VSFYDVSVAIGWLAVVLGCVVAYAQYRRISTRGVEGVSFTTWTLFIYLGIFWVVYGFDVHSWELIIGCGVTLPLQFLIWYRLKPWERIRANVYSFTLISSFCVLPALAWGWSGAVVGVGMAGWVTRGPQLMKLVRSRAAAGVSTSSWLTAGFVSGLWVIYYFGAKLWPVMFVTAVGGFASLVIGALASWRHRQVHDVAIDATFPKNLATLDD